MHLYYVSYSFNYTFGIDNSAKKIKIYAIVTEPSYGNDWAANEEK